MSRSTAANIKKRAYLNAIRDSRIVVSARTESRRNAGRRLRGRSGARIDPRRKPNRDPRSSTSTASLSTRLHATLRRGTRVRVRARLRVRQSERRVCSQARPGCSDYQHGGHCHAPDGAHYKRVCSPRRPCLSSSPVTAGTRSLQPRLPWSACAPADMNYRSSSAYDLGNQDTSLLLAGWF